MWDFVRTEWSRPERSTLRRARLLDTIDVGMAKSTETSVRHSAPTIDVDANDTARGMKVPDGMNRLVQAVPSSIPPELFEEAPPSAPIVLSPKPVPPRPASVPKMPAVLTSAARVKAVSATTAPDPLPSPTAAPPGIPSSFPALEKTLVLDMGVRSLPPSQADAAPPLLEAVPPPAPVPQFAQPAPEIPLTTTPDLAPRSSRAPAILAALAGFVAAIAVGGFFLFRPKTIEAPPPSAHVSEPPAPTATATATATATTTEPAPAAESAPVEPAAQVSDVPPGMGRITTVGAKSGWRIFVDGRTVGQTPQPVLVKCGSRTVKVGSAGRAKTVDVPCSGEISVVP